MTDILTLDGHPYRPIVQCDPEEHQLKCVRYALTDGECCLHGCVDCPARLYEVPIIQIVDAPVVRFSERFLIAAIIVCAVLGGIVGHSAVDRQESAYRYARV